MVDQLSRLPARSRKTSTVNCIIQATLKQEQQVLTCDSLHASGPFKVVAKLAFENEINPFDLLLLAQLLTIANQRFTAAQGISVLPRWLCTTLFNRTRRLVASVPFKKKFCSLAAAQTAHRISIPSQVFSASSLLDGKVYRLRFSAGPSSFGLIQFQILICQSR
jgi:hypothetical protein